MFIVISHGSGVSTLPNLFEPLISSGIKDHRIIFSESG